METTASYKLPKFQILGLTLVINFNERIEDKADEDGEVSTFYHYTTAKMCKTTSSDERVECIIRSKYPTYGAEFAAMHKGGAAADEYMAFRDAAKVLARESFEL